MSGYVFMEKYRPTTFDGIILDPLNKEILTNVIETGYFPNLLFYGPPGTGKTTTIINLINAYQEKYNQKNKELMIHLNASDERGIDVIRSQISQFVNSKTLFHVGMKFVILDEVDYMTKNAQQALRYLLQNYTNTVRFCLICNYISRIDEGLQHDFLKLRFNQLPEKEIIKFLANISECENLSFSEKSLELIQQLHKSDIRSMINFMQTNQDLYDEELNIIDESVWIKLFEMLKNENILLKQITKEINDVSVSYNIDEKNIIKDFVNYLIRKEESMVTTKFLKSIENIMHFDESRNDHYVQYSLIKIRSNYINSNKTI
jgi:DNA polymerase III delta prime subunit